MAIDTYTRSFAEILTQVSKIKTKKEKVQFLRQYQTDALRMICKSSFDPKIVWELPEGDVPYTPKRRFHTLNLRPPVQYCSRGLCQHSAIILSMSRCHNRILQVAPQVGVVFFSTLPSHSRALVRLPPAYGKKQSTGLRGTRAVDVRQ